MLTEICGYLRNYFDRDMPKYYGKFTVADGEISCDDGNLELLDGQYFRIVGSALNDGVWKNGDFTNFEKMQDETFTGAVWAMAVPPALIGIAQEIAEWNEKYGKADSTALSPFNSESFDGYSYSKSRSGVSGSSEADASSTWQGAFGKRLLIWKKL